MTPVYIGIDGGGTKTNAVALDRDGTQLTQATGGGMNYNFIPLDDAVDNLCGVIRRLAAGLENGGFKIMACALGDSSADDEAPHKLSGDFVHKFREKAGIGFDVPILIKSDVFMSLYGLTGGAPGVLVVGGTGSMGIGVDREGRIFTAGGWGAPGTDPGSGYDIAVRALEAVFSYADGIGPPTALTDEAFRFFGAAKPRELISVFNGGNCSRGDIASFAVKVSECARAGDKTAASVVKKAGGALADYACSLIRRINCDGCIVGIYGGVFLHNAEVRKRFTRLVRRRYPDARVGFPDIPPEVAAARYAIDNTDG